MLLRKVEEIVLRIIKEEKDLDLDRVLDHLGIEGEILIRDREVIHEIKEDKYFNFYFNIKII